MKKISLHRFACHGIFIPQIWPTIDILTHSEFKTVQISYVHTCTYAWMYAGKSSL
jgi:hypothetical protein